MIVSWRLPPLFRTFLASPLLEEFTYALFVKSSNGILDGWYKTNSLLEDITKSYEKPLKLDNVHHITYHPSPRVIFIDMWEQKVFEWVQNERKKSSENS